MPLVGFLVLCADWCCISAAAVLQWRYAVGEDREALVKATRQDTADDKAAKEKVHQIKVRCAWLLLLWLAACSSVQVATGLGYCMLICWGFAVRLNRLKHAWCAAKWLCIHYFCPGWPHAPRHS